MEEQESKFKVDQIGYCAALGKGTIVEVEKEGFHVKYDSNPDQTFTYDNECNYVIEPSRSLVFSEKEVFVVGDLLKTSDIPNLNVGDSVFTIDDEIEITEIYCEDNYIANISGTVKSSGDEVEFYENMQTKFLELENAIEIKLYKSLPEIQSAIIIETSVGTVGVDGKIAEGGETERVQ